MYICSDCGVPHDESEDRPNETPGGQLTCVEVSDSELFCDEFLIGQKHCADGYPKPLNNVSDAYKRGYYTQQESMALAYEREQVATQRSLNR